MDSLSRAHGIRFNWDPVLFAFITPICFWAGLKRRDAVSKGSNTDKKALMWKSGGVCVWGGVGRLTSGIEKVARLAQKQDRNCAIGQLVEMFWSVAAGFIGASDSK